MIAKLAVESLKSRRTSVLLTLLSVILSVSLLMSVEFVRTQVKSSFTRTVSGVDLIVGARTSQLNLLLATVFRIGSVDNGMRWESVELLEQNPGVSWLIPLSLGDAHKGFRVVGTTNGYFSHFKYGQQQSLAFSSGGAFTADRSTVVGYQVAKQLGYKIGQKIVISHGLGDVSFSHHDDHPFVISGVLAPTGTPVDDAVYVTLNGLEAAHVQPSIGQRLTRRPQEDNMHKAHSESAESEVEGNNSPADNPSSASALGAPHPEKVTAVMVGLTSRIAVLQVQHQVNQNENEALTAVLPGVALNQLWQLMGNMEKLLLAISVLILLASLLGLATMLLATMRERRQEIAILRTMGAGPVKILWLVQAEALLISGLGCVISFILVSSSIALLADYLNSEYGLYLTGSLMSQNILVVIGAILAATWLVSFIPAMKAYKTALHSGLSR